MSTDSDLLLTEHEKFREMCVLLPTGTLSGEEQMVLQKHLVRCQECQALLADDQNDGAPRMAALAAAVDPIREPDANAFSWDIAAAQEKLLNTVRVGGKRERSLTPKPVPGEVSPLRVTGLAVLRKRVLGLLPAAAALAFSIIAAYGFGYRHANADLVSHSPTQNPETAMLREQIQTLQTQRAELQQQLKAGTQSVTELTAHAGVQEKELARLEGLQGSFDAQSQQQTANLAAVSAERDQLARNLQDVQKAYNAAQNNLSQQMQQRQEALLRSTNLDSQLDLLSAQLHAKEAEINQQKQFLDADRDIREMMGARKLYIADVYDVDGGGQTKKPFGRVFYTKAQSLVFYAFDLDQTPGYRPARTFQAWGRQGQDGAQPLNLGIFYMDNETNRRWVVKSEDAVVLSQIDAVFVTAEPKGGSHKPSSKPFLYAYLHTAPINHP